MISNGYYVLNDTHIVIVLQYNTYMFLDNWSGFI